MECRNEEKTHQKTKDTLKMQTSIHNHNKRRAFRNFSRPFDTFQVLLGMPMENVHINGELAALH